MSSSSAAGGAGAVRVPLGAGSGTGQVGQVTADIVARFAGHAEVVAHLAEEVAQLREKLRKASEALEAIQKLAIEHSGGPGDGEHGWYFDLVWYSRGDSRQSKVLAHYEGDKMEQMRREMEILGEEGGDWHHGFNSGMLAASRLYGAFACAVDDTHGQFYEGEAGSDNEWVETPAEQRQQALSDFPSLDS
jgi:hypothetical protein